MLARVLFVTGSQHAAWSTTCFTDTWGAASTMYRTTSDGAVRTGPVPPDEQNGQNGQNGTYACAGDRELARRTVSGCAVADDLPAAGPSPAPR